MQGHMHHKRRLLIALVATSGFSVGLGVVRGHRERRAADVRRHRRRKHQEDHHGRRRRRRRRSTRSSCRRSSACRSSTSRRSRRRRLPLRPLRRVTAPTASPRSRPPGEAIADERDHPGSARRPATKKRAPRTGERALDSAGTSSRARSRRCSVPGPRRRSCASPTAFRRCRTRPCPWHSRARWRSAFRTSSSTSSASPSSCSRSTRPPASSTACRWEVLAAINEIETDYGRNLNVSTRRRGRLDAVHPVQLEDVRRRRQRRRQEGPVQPGRRDLRRRALPQGRRRAGQDLRKAIFAYNHADWYVNSVLMRARFIGGMPADLVGSLSGLTQGRFPVHADGEVRRRHLRARRPRAASHGARTPRCRSSQHVASRDQHLREGGLAGHRRPGRQDRQGRQQRAPRQLRRCCATSTATRTPTRA